MGEGMSILNKIKNKFKPLRELCRCEYGDEFIDKYDKLNGGIPIGNFEETIEFIEKVNAVKKKFKR
jgi:hypothetical protein